MAPHPALSDEEVEDQRIVTTYKQFSDFRFLEQIIRFSEFNLSGDLDGLPMLPEKRNENGTKKSGEEMQGELEAYINELVQIPIVARMLQMKLFFGVNTYENLAEEEKANEKVNVSNVLYPEESLPSQTVELDK